MTNRSKVAAGIAALAAAAGGVVAGVQLTGSSGSAGPCYTIAGSRSPAGVFRYNANAKTTTQGHRLNFTVEHPCMTEGYVKPPAKAIGSPVTVAAP